ncbi:DsbC family protein [Geobacter sp.]|uniref:DsbC family protein n=1 Tax=Geobacter sp. TaxID=46610 RepID=UPI00262C8692|nr:DsbC family protein [Geobacter sp.]
MSHLRKKKWIGAFSLFLCCMTSAALAASGNGAREDNPEAAIRKLFPRLPVSSVTKTDIDGFYEVVADGNVLYVHLKSGHIFVGDLYTREGRNLTAEARSRFAAERLRLLTDADKKLAVKVGNGKHVVIEVTDPDCPFCRKMHEYWARRPDVTRYVFFLPLSIHPNAEKKARYILAAENKELALWEVYSGELDNNREKLDKPYDDKGLLAAQRAVVTKLGVQSTPTFWVDGKYVSGANIPLIESIIGKCKLAEGVKPGAAAACEDEGEKK